MKGQHVTAAKTPASNAKKDVDEIEAYFERMEQRTAQGWRPEPGTTMDGTVIGLRMGSSEYGDYPIVVYKVNKMFRADGTIVPSRPTVALHIFHQVLRERMAELKTDIDTRQYVTYIGQVESNSRKDKDGDPVKYHHYDAENYGETETTGRQEGFTFGS
jgi:hypothetical protein